MPLFYVSVISALSILPPFILAILFFRRLNGKYLPLLVLLSFGLINEVISYVSIILHATNSINGNIYILADFLLVVWLFAKLNRHQSKKIISGLIIGGVAVWMIDNLLIHSLEANNSMFRMVASLIILYMSIDKVNHILFFKTRFSLKNTDLLICMGFIIYHTYKTFVEAFHIYPMKLGAIFYERLWVILAIINIITNLLFTLAILCIRQKQEYILPLSRASQF
jgi:hypothetical protein